VKQNTAVCWENDEAMIASRSPPPLSRGPRADGTLYKRFTRVEVPSERKLSCIAVDAAGPIQVLAR
jgi:hypothetical protein